MPGPLHRQFKPSAQNGTDAGRELYVLKFGAEIIADAPALAAIARTAVQLKSAGKDVVLAHGGGNQVDEKLNAAGIPVVRNATGVRLTTAEAMEIMIPCMQELNAQICAVIDAEAQAQGASVRAVGRGGSDGALVTARPKFEGTLTGDVLRVDAAQFEALLQDGGIPVIHPVCAGEDAPHMNVNADDVAGGIAMALGARRLVFCTNTYVRDKQDQRISTIYESQIESLVADETLKGGMANKVRACAEVVRSGRVGGVVILDGKNPQALARELGSDDGAGTLILAAPAKPATHNKPSP